MMRWVVRSIPHGGPIEHFIIPASIGITKELYQWYVLSCLCDAAYRRILAANWGFLFHCLSGPIRPMPYTHT